MAGQWHIQLSTHFAIIKNLSLSSHSPPARRALHSETGLQVPVTSYLLPSQFFSVLLNKVEKNENGHQEQWICHAGTEPQQ